MAERERFGYTGAEGNRVSALRDMFDGGGRGRSGSQFEGGGFISSIGNAMGGPAAFGGGDNSRDSRGAVIGRTVGGMMFGPLGMLGGGLLGNMIGGGMRRGPDMAPTASMAPPRRPSMPAAMAVAPMTSPAPTPRPAAAGGMAGLSLRPMPPATQRFIEQYGAGFGMSPPRVPTMIPGAVPYNLPPITFDAAPPMMVDPMTGLPVAMAPPRVR